MKLPVVADTVFELLVRLVQRLVAVLLVHVKPSLR